MMDELYSNLENYNEVATLDELKSENMELKTKLENYASAMDKLQKNILQDFDTLSSEFKKLEHNYSSLLITAKSEIERKTQIITNINMEKDMLILTALKNGDKSVLNIKKNIPSYNKNKRKQNNGAGKCVKNTKGVQDDQKKKCDSENIRLQEHKSPSNKRVNNIGRENIQKQNIFNTIAPKTDSYNHGHTKENNQHINITPIAQHENIVHPGQSKSMNIKSRRKSTIAAENECERLTVTEKVDCLTVDCSQQDVHTRDKEDRKTFVKYDIDRHSSKSSEASSRDERILNYREPSRDLYKARAHKHYDSDKHRNRDKYDMSQKYKKRYSPERYEKHPKHYEDNNHKSDFSRNRDSPPVDRFHHPSYKEQVDHERFKYNEHERYAHSKEKYTSKHKIPYEYEEPYTKRPKTDYYGRQKNDVKWHGEEFLEHQELTETFEMLQKQYTSCQSPDYTYSEIASEPIKVIMDTAETPLEDPRLATSKYILSNDNGSVSLSTANGRHVNLEPIDKTKWQLQNVLIPNALIKPLTEDQLIKDLYMDTDIPQLQLSIESGEASEDLQVVSNKQLTKDKQADNKCHGDIIEKTSLAKKYIENVGKPTQGCLTSYKIPKITKCDQDIKSNAFVKERSLDVIQELYTQNDDKNDKQNLNCDSNKLSLENFEKHDNISNNFIRSDKKNGAVLQNSIDVHDNERVLSTREIVEGDLELSDETCDTDLQKNVKHRVHEEHVNSHYENNICPSNLKEKSTFSSLKNCQLDHSEPNHKDNLLVDVEKSLPHDINEEHNEVNKKQKNKKKTHKHRDIEHTDVNDKKFKSKRDKKDKPKEVKSKFNDLFGDSNSLITPDDLGISASQVQTSSQLAGICLPIFEDAQDATDLEQTSNIKTPSVPITKAVSEEDTLVVKDNEKILESNCKIDEISKIDPELIKYDAKVSNKSETAVNVINDNLKLENYNKENDIVTTIIISTGVQPDEINTESRAESLVNADELLSEEIVQDHIDATQKQQDVFIKALATSTPHKQMVHQIALENDSKLPDSNFTSNSILTNHVNDETCVPNTNNATEPPNEDLPDVRIFVKRRRRVVKTTK